MVEAGIIAIRCIPPARAMSRAPMSGPIIVLVFGANVFISFSI